MANFMAPVNSPSGPHYNSFTLKFLFGICMSNETQSNGSYVAWSLLFPFPLPE